MAHHNPLKVVIPTFQMKLGELVRGFKSQLKCMDLLCLWLLSLRVPSALGQIKHWPKIFYLQMPLYHYLSSPSQCTRPLPSSLSPSFCQYAASVARCSLESYCCQDKTWLLYPPCGPGQSQNSQEPEEVFTEPKRTVKAMAILEGWLWEGETKKTPSSTSMLSISMSCFPQKQKKSALATPICVVGAFQAALVVKNTPNSAGEIRSAGLIPGLGRSPRGPWQSTPVSLHGESPGHSSLAGCSP